MPMGHGGKPPKGARVPAKFDAKVIKRLLKYMKPFRKQLILVAVCIVISAVASVSSSLFIKTLIDDNILPIVEATAGGATADFSGFIRTLILMGSLFLLGSVCALVQARVMANISQGILKTVRDDMFSHMQTLPIKYFDTHTHGDVMSFYTNDADAMQQMLSQSLPQFLSSGITVIAVFCSMLSLSLWLTLAVVVMLVLIMFITAKVAGKSGTFFVRQQKSMANLNGYIEEMINGQRVIKMFCREEKAKEQFDERNFELSENVCKANAFANVLMPINNCMGYLLYVILAIFGGFLAINNATNVACFSVGVLTLGSIASFLQLSRSFIGPIGQVSQQLNSVVMAQGEFSTYLMKRAKPMTATSLWLTRNTMKTATSPKPMSALIFGLGSTHIPTARSLTPS